MRNRPHDPRAEGRTLAATRALRAAGRGLSLCVSAILGRVDRDVA